MPRKSRFTDEQKMDLLRRAVRENTAKLCAEYGISLKTYYRWRLLYEPDALPGWVLEDKIPENLRIAFAHIQAALRPLRTGLIYSLNHGVAALRTWETSSNSFRVYLKGSYFSRAAIDSLLSQPKHWYRNRLIIARFIPRSLGAQLAEKGLNFVDKAGNMRIVFSARDVPRVVLYVLGKKDVRANSTIESTPSGATTGTNV